MTFRSLLPARLGARLLPRRAEEVAFLPGDLRTEMNRLFDDFFRGSAMEWPATWDTEFSAYTPRVDMSESEKEVIVTAELPGLTEKDVEVTVTEDTLTISGEKKEEKEEKAKGYYRMERSYGSFRRCLPMPCEISQDKIDATFKDGILKVVLPKTPAAKKNGKKIAVKSV